MAKNSSGRGRRSDGSSSGRKKPRSRNSNRAADSKRGGAPDTKKPHDVDPVPLAASDGRLDKQAIRPKWDKRQRSLSFGKLLVKRFQREAPVAERILDAFEEQGWPPRIDDPLPPIPGSPEAGRLRNEVHKLNGGLDDSLIRFTMDGTGQGIKWEPTERA